MAFAATKKQGTISGYWFDEDSFLWRYAFTFSEPSAASKFLEIAKEGKSIQDAADAAGVEIECDSDENVVKATSVGDRKATVITISEKLPCVEDWYKIAKSYDGKADVTCRALAQETGEKYFNYRYLGDGNKGQPVLVQGNVKESKEMEEEEKELVDIDNLKVEKDYIDDNGKIFDIYYDEGDESPRKMYDNGATIVILRGKYESPDEITDELEEIADEHDISLSKDCDLNALISALQEAGYYAVPVYILDHGNVRYSTHDFGDKWDSGMAGVAYVKKSGADEKKLQKMIDAELAEYETWANGNVYGISVRNEDGEVVDVEGGFYLSDNTTWEDLIKEMLDAVEVKIQDKYERFHGFEDDEDDYEDDEEPIEESRKPKDKRVYAEIYSYGIPSHITWFDNLKTAKMELENHIVSMTKVGDYEIFRDEKAADVKMREGDFEITLYVPSGSEDVVDNDVEHVIIRPKKEPVKEEINKMKKQLKTDVTPVMNKIKVIGAPIDKSDFWFYTEEITDDEGNPTVFHAQEGTGDNLDIEDEKKGFVDYIYYDTYDGEINYSMINNYISGDDYDTLDDFESDGGMILLYNPYTKLTVKQICWHILDMSGVSNPENLTVRILTGKQKDTSFPKETNESFDDTNSSTSKTDVTPMMNKIKVIGNPVDKSDFWFYVYNKDVDKQKTYHVYEGTGDNLSIEDEKQGFADYINYDSYKGVDGVGGLDAIDVINNYISGDDEDTLSGFEDDGGMVLLYNPYKNLTVKQICWKVLDMDGVPHPENLTAIILMTKTEMNEERKTNTSKTDVTPVMNKIKVYGSNSTHPHDKTDFWFYVYDDAVDKYNAYHVYAGTDDNLSIDDEKQGFVDCIKYDSYKDVHSNDSVLPLNVIVSYISGDDDTLSNFYDDSRMIPLYNPYINLTVQQICWKVLNKDGVPHPENLTAYIVYTYYDVWD